MLSLCFVIGLAVGIQDLCSSQNTAHNSGNFSIYQSNGLCQNFCSDQRFSFAIVKGKHCWCSDTSPSTSADVSSCNEPCPGYPYEACGSSDQELFGYIEIGIPLNTEWSSTSNSPTYAEQSTYSTPGIISTSGSPRESFISFTIGPVSSSAFHSSTISTPPLPSSSSASASLSSAASSSHLHGLYPSVSSASTPSHRSTFSPSSMSSKKAADAESSSLAGNYESKGFISASSTIESSIHPHATTSSIDRQSSGTTSALVASSSHADSNARERSSTHNAFMDNAANVAGVFTVVGVVGFGIAALLIKLLLVCYGRKASQQDCDVENSSSETRKGVDQRLEPSAVYAREGNDHDSEKSLADCKDYSRRCLAVVVNPDYPE